MPQPKKPIGLRKQKAVAISTSAKKPMVKEFGPKYKYMGGDSGGVSYSGKINGKPTQKDSSDYRKGYEAGVMEVSRKSKSELGGQYKKGLTWRGVNARYNEGFSEGKDVALERKKSK
jgi:hypothetical protein